MPSPDECSDFEKLSINAMSDPDLMNANKVFVIN